MRLVAPALCFAWASLALPASAGSAGASAAETADAPAASPAPAIPRRADFAGATPSPEARDSADWALVTDDARGLPFLVIDKKQAQVFAFDATGRLLGAAPALLGLALGDESMPGIGNRPLASIKPAERTTPAGRFVAALDRNLKGQDILWIDYDAGIALHRVVPGTAAERRSQRLASPSPADNRVTFGCINVPVDFFDAVVLRAFAAAGGIVYVLPESRPVQEFIGPDGSPQRRF